VLLALTVVAAPAVADIGSVRIGRFTVEFSSANLNLKSGDFTITGGLKGHSSDGDFSADRAFGNRERKQITLVGHVVAHRHGAGFGSQPVVLTSDTAEIDENLRRYSASGNVLAVEGARSMSAARITMDDASHLVTLSGGVHVSQPPGNTVDTDTIVYHDDTGDIIIPGPLRGSSSDADFRADRALGNLSRDELTLIGNVVAHTSGGGKPGEETQPLTVQADQVRMESAVKRFSAIGHVRVTQEGKPAPGATTTGARTLETENVTYNTDSGDIKAPGEVRGEVDQGAFRADSVSGNTRTQEFDLVGHVKVTRTRATAKKASASKPVTLTADRLHVAQRKKLYLATGNVKLIQTDRTIGAPRMTLNDVSHVATLTGGVHAAQAPDRVADTSQVSYHTDSGDFVVPTEITGHSKTDTFRADRAFGNAAKNVYTLEGHVKLQRSGGFGQADSSRQATALECERFRIDAAAKIYTATGSPKLTQGQRTLSGQIITLDDNTHLVHVTGGAHAEQPPNRKFDAPELVYDTQTDNFKAVGGVTVTFPVQRATPTPTPTPAPKGKKGATPASSATPAPSPTAAATSSPSR